MSFKYKIPLLMLIVFIINTVMILAFFLFYQANVISKKLETMQEQVDNLSGQIAEDINGESLEDAIIYLSKVEESNLVFTLQSTSGETIEIDNSNVSAKSGFSAIQSVILGGAPYVLFVQQHVDIINLRPHSIVSDILYFECLVMFVMLLLVSIALHFRYVKPLVRLKDNMNHYNKEEFVALPVHRKDEIGQLENSFIGLSKSLSEEKQTQTRIIASISHDIKTPLTSVMGYAERLIKKDFDKEKQRQYLKTIYTQAKDIENIVLEFDEYLGNNVQNQLNLQPYGTAYICDMLSDEYTQQLSERGITFLIENKCAPDSEISADIVKLRRIFANIVGNSVRHGNTENLSISIIVKEDTDHIRFDIADNGPGVPESELPRIFEPFYTSDKSRRVSGLGLSICQSIMYAHGGRIYPNNNCNGGLTITLEFDKLCHQI